MKEITITRHYNPASNITLTPCEGYEILDIISLISEMKLIPRVRIVA